VFLPVWGRTEGLVSLNSLDGWFVECQDGWRVGGDATLCDGPSRGRLVLTPEGMRFSWDVAWSDWVQALYLHRVPVDLSSSPVVSIGLSGDTPVHSEIVLMAVDRHDVFFGHTLLRRIHGLERMSRWEIQTSVPRESFGYLFNMRGQPPSDLDWRSIERVFLSVVRSSPGAAPGSSGSGRFWIRSLSTEPVPVSRLSLWREDPPDPESWTRPRAPLAQREKAAPWIMECDGGDEDANAFGCRADRGSLFPGGGGSTTFDWDTSKAEWIQAARDFPSVLDLRSADRFYVDLRLSGGLGTPNVLYFLVADDGGVYAGYEAGLRHLSSAGYDEYRLHLSIAKELMWFHFDLRETRKHIDWSRIKRIFVGVKRAVGNTVGETGRVTLEDITVHLAPSADVPPAVRREQWTYALFYNWNNAALSTLARADLEKVAEHLRWQTRQTLLITSLADIREDHAQTLAQERATHVAETLTHEFNVDPARLKIETPPPHRPLAGERLPRTVLRLATP
jgi:hypothetical protein